jgi:hypothetical protein
MCGLGLSEPEGFLELLRIARSEGDRYVLTIADGDLRLDASTGEVRLDLGFAGGAISVRGVTRAMAGNTPVGLTSVRGDVTSGSLDVTINRKRFTCPELMDFSFLVSGAP